MKPVQLAFVMTIFAALTGCNTTSLESAAPASSTATSTTGDGTPPPVASQVNDPFMLEVVGQCRIKVANDNGVKTESVSVGTMTPSADGKSQFIEATVNSGKKFRCNYDPIGNFLGATPVA